ncbi:MAG TPA: GlmL-related ornithine degradation protein [Thermotogota bacterium]|nr:GlmL-related ornithine degradation protein [Thermotogota bacterium]
MHINAIIAEIGSTTTLLSAVDGINTKNPVFLGQGEHYTTVQEGDVTLGIEKALKLLEQKLGGPLDWDMFLASSSAAGGLRVTVHGLVYDMTVKAAKEAALGAGAIIKHVTAGKLSVSDFEKTRSINPNMVLIAGGVDHGESETVIYNARMFAQSALDCPYVYAGNTAVADQVKEILEAGGKKTTLTENVYPKVDELNVEPVRKVLQDLFSKHITHARGMEKIEEVVKYPIIPTPAAVMQTSQLLAQSFGDVLCVDIGGATTDIDSVTQGNPELAEYASTPEPFAKRTVEGDLGIFVNATHLTSMIGAEMAHSYPNFKDLLERLTPYPQNEEMEAFAAFLAKYCFTTAIRRHAGRLKYYYGPLGRKKSIEGRDLTYVKAVFGTGGILSRSRYSSRILNAIRSMAKQFPNELLPSGEVKLFRDKHYLFAPIGVLSTVDEESAKRLLHSSIEALD